MNNVTKIAGVLCRDTRKVGLALWLPCALLAAVVLFYLFTATVAEWVCDYYVGDMGETTRFGYFLIGLVLEAMFIVLPLWLLWAVASYCKWTYVRATGAEFTPRKVWWPFLGKPKKIYVQFIGDTLPDDFKPMPDTGLAVLQFLKRVGANLYVGAGWRVETTHMEEAIASTMQRFVNKRAKEGLDIAAKVSYIKLHEPAEIWVHPQVGRESK